MSKHTSGDWPPSDHEKASDDAVDALASVIHRDDPDTEPDPLDIIGSRSLTGSTAEEMDQVRWSADGDAIDYAFLKDLADPREFELTADVLDRLIAVNRFVPGTSNPFLVFALRGAVLAEGFEVLEQSRVRLVNTRPDHRTLRCVVGLYHRTSRRLSVFSGSTVPCRKAISDYAKGGTPCNLLPTGLWSHYVWRHKKLKPVLRLSSGNASTQALEQGGEATVLRDRGSRQLECSDLFDRSRPLDNIHCTYYLDEQSALGASFSSWGCTTIRGTRAPGQQWASFTQSIATLAPGTRVDFLLLTGKEAALVASGADESACMALRPGSRGDEVSTLQRQLGLEATAYFGAATADRFTGIQRRVNTENGLGPIADGLYTQPFEARSGWSVFQLAFA